MTWAKPLALAAIMFAFAYLVQKPGDNEKSHSPGDPHGKSAILV